MAARAPPNENGGGYDYEFVKTPLDDLICTVCFLPSKEPHLSACCGHTFCKSCLEGSKKFSNICPMCRSEIFAIRSLHVFCTNKKQGCEWQGEVNDITNHLGNCFFQVIHCPNDCGESLQRQYLTSHVETECPRRTVSCQYCNDVGEYQFIEGQHKEECPKFPVQCPNECEIESIHRDEVEEHREVCPLEIIQCDYHVVGCEVKMARKDMNTHKQEKMEVHLSLSINELMELQFTQNNFKREVEKTTQHLVLHTTKIADTERQLATSQQRAKKTKDELTALVENLSSSNNKHLNIVKQAANTQLATIENLKQQLTVSQHEAKMTKENLTLQLAHTTAKLTAIQQDAKRTKDQLLQKLTATEKELNSTKQQLATTCQNLTKAEKEHTTLAASTDKALAEMERKITELETKLQQKTEVIEGIISDSWSKSLQYRASQFSLGNQVIPVVVKMTSFTMHKNNAMHSKQFYDNFNKEHEIQLKVATSFTDLTVCLTANCRQPDKKFVVRLLNQTNDNQHRSVLTSLQFIEWFFQKEHYEILISLDDLHQITPTCQFLKNGTLFFEVLPKS